MVLPIERFKFKRLLNKDMTKSTSFTAIDQKDKDGKVIDKIFTIKEVETIEYEKTKTMSGTEVAEKIKDLEYKLAIADKQSFAIQEEINFLKSLK